VVAYGLSLENPEFGKAEDAGRKLEISILAGPVLNPA